MFRSPHTLPLLTLITAFVLASSAALFMSVQSAHAEVTGDCIASIAGVNVAGVDSGNRDDDIHVGQDETVSVGAVSPIGFESHKIQLEFASNRWTVKEADDDGSNSWTGTVNVDDYASWGIGLYKVIGVSTLSDGSTCEGAATVDVGGNPLTTLAGGVAAGVAVVGTVGALTTTTIAATRRPGPLSDFGPVGEMVGEEWASQEADSSEPPSEEADSDGKWTEEDERREVEYLGETGKVVGATGKVAGVVLLAVPKASVISNLGCICFAALAVFMMPLVALTGGGAGVGSREPAEPAQPTTGSGKQRQLPRPRWLPRITLLGLVSGFLAGGGIVVLLQQYSIQYPTLGTIITWVLVGMAVYGIVLPTIGYTFGWWRMNARISRLEKQLR